MINRKPMSPVQRPQQFGSRRCGFTLIELLVVVAIIALLAAMLMVSLAAAKSRADKVVCMNNLHQISLGMQMYLNDHHVYPPGAAGSTSAAQALLPYVPAPLPLPYRPPWDTGSLNPTNYHWITRSGLWVCPGYNRLRGISDYGFVASYGYNVMGIAAIGSPLDGLPGFHSLGIGYHHVIYPSKNSAPVGIPVPEDEVVTPSDMIAWGDSVLFKSPQYRDGPLLLHGSTGLEQVWDRLTNEPLLHDTVDTVVPMQTFAVAVQEIARRHGGRWNITFCDGHIESLRTRDFCDPANGTQRQRWSRDHLPHFPDSGTFLTPQ